MYKVYHINEAQRPAAAKRTIISALKVMLVVYLLLMAYLFFTQQLAWRYVLLSATVCIPAYGLALLIGYALLKQKYSRYRIVVDDEGVEFYMPPNDKKINWQNLSLIQRQNGIIELRDKSKSAFVRWLSGEGSLQLLPEIENFEELTTVINQHVTKAGTQAR